MQSCFKNRDQSASITLNWIKNPYLIILGGLALFLPSSSPSCEPRVKYGPNEDKNEAKATNQSNNQPNLPAFKGRAVT
jgi:hypothetical protein